jgi:exonuclease SbcD
MALRLLHTSDWHLGHQLHGFDRSREHAGVLAWLLGVIAKEKVDVLLVAGDVFDSANPPTEALAQWYAFLGEAWRRFERLQIVVIGGNHDSPLRLDATGPLLKALDRLHVVGGAARKAGALDHDRHAIPLFDRKGKRAAWVAAVPHLRASETGTGDEAAVGAGVRRFYGAVLDRIRAQRTAEEPIVAMGHLYVAGGKVSDLSERRLAVGNETAVGVDLFPDDVAYAALGHLHLAQPVGGREHVRYSGSLIPLSLPERDYAHQAVLVDLDGAKVAGLRPLHAPRFVELPRIPAKGAAPIEEVLAAVAALPSRSDAPVDALPLLEIEVALDRPEPALRQRIDEALQGKRARLARLGVTATGSGAALADLDEFAARHLAELKPQEVLRARWQRDHQGEPPPELLRTFDELLDRVMQEEA